MHVASRVTAFPRSGNRGVGFGFIKAQKLLGAGKESGRVQEHVQASPLGNTVQQTAAISAGVERALSGGTDEERGCGQ